LGAPSKAIANPGQPDGCPGVLFFFISYTKEFLFAYSKNKTLTARSSEGLLWLCGERGIRTPGTVTHTAV